MHTSNCRRCTFLIDAGRDGINKVEGLIHDPGTAAHPYAEDVGSKMAAALPLGHGMVLTLPDQPFRRWGYVDRDGNAKRRDNQAIFLKASERLLDLFSYYRGHGAGGSLSDVDRAVLKWAFATFTDESGDARHDAWMELLSGKRDGMRFSFGALSEEELEQVRYVPKGKGSWKFKALGTDKVADDPGDIFTYSDVFDRCDWKRFHDALKDHRSEVLDGIVVREFGLQAVPSV